MAFSAIDPTDLNAGHLNQVVRLSWVDPYGDGRGNHSMVGVLTSVTQDQTGTDISLDVAGHRLQPSLTGPGFELAIDPRP